MFAPFRRDRIHDCGVFTVPAVCLLLGLLECGIKWARGWQMCQVLLLSRLRAEETVTSASSHSACLLVHNLNNQQ